ncbi:hypothetical protein Desaci_1380 [Desulfosporosinus acidiphilus SJ4]|uniref:Uncharacterized protein n=1 Tax=Desulfosporosinus acidiphilus (strain DSM 22704 / JCM 16185 / SJ4) TaxID=646529 RepID=I4D3M9_DESAJ|nr:hypothetical protein Desaci_1380 [Desulfosporosinus acidiphilus SJ4]
MIPTGSGIIPGVEAKIARREEVQGTILVMADVSGLNSASHVIVRKIQL